MIISDTEQIYRGLIHQNINVKVCYKNSISTRNLNCHDLYWSCSHSMVKNRKNAIQDFQISTCPPSIFTCPISIFTCPPSISIFTCPPSIFTHLDCRSSRMFMPYYSFLVNVLKIVL